MQSPRPTIIKAHPYSNRLKRLPLQISSCQYVTISAILQLINSYLCIFTQSDDLSPLCSNACSITFQYDDCVGEIANSVSAYFGFIILQCLQSQYVFLSLLVFLFQSSQLALGITNPPEIRLCLSRVRQCSASFIHRVSVRLCPDVITMSVSYRSQPCRCASYNSFAYPDNITGPQCLLSTSNNSSCAASSIS